NADLAEDASAPIWIGRRDKIIGNSNVARCYGGAAGLEFDAHVTELPPARIGVTHGVLVNDNVVHVPCLTATGCIGIARLDNEVLLPVVRCIVANSYILKALGPIHRVIGIWMVSCIITRIRVEHA